MDAALWKGEFAELFFLKFMQFGNLCFENCTEMKDWEKTKGNPFIIHLDNSC